MEMLQQFSPVRGELARLAELERQRQMAVDEEEKRRLDMVCF